MDDRSGGPDVETSSIDVIVVPLVGDDDAGSPQSQADEPHRPQWRRTIAIALVGGTVLGVAGAMLVLGSDDDPLETAATTIPPDELSARITTPPTLETLPPPEDPATRRAPPGPPTSATAVTVPSYPPVTDVGLVDLVQFDIAGAVDRLAEDRPRRSDTRVELGNGGFVIDITIERDPVLDRYRAVFRSGVRTEEVTIDVPGNRTVVVRELDSGPDLLELSNDELLAGSGATSVNELFDPLLLGPLRPETFEAAATRGRGLVTVDDVRVARRFLTVVRGELIPEWQLYAFAPQFDFPIEDRPPLLEYSVYVSESGDVVQVDGVSLIGDVPQLVTHRLTEPAEPITIEMPDGG